MSSRLNEPGLLDARLLLLDNIESDEEFYLFSDFLEKISNNENVKISARSKAWLMKQYEKSGYPESNERIPTSVKRIILKSISRIQYSKNLDLQENKFLTNFIDREALLGEDEEYIDCLISDLSSLFGWSYLYIISKNKFWSENPVFDPTKFHPVNILFANDLYELVNYDENFESQIEKLRSSIPKFQNKSILIFGGKKDQRVIEVLSNFCLIEDSEIKWIESEKNKKSKNLKNSYRSLGGDTHLAILFAGAVGHGESNPFKKHCIDNNIPFAFVSDMNSVCKDLVNQLK